MILTTVGRQVLLLFLHRHPNRLYRPKFTFPLIRNPPLTAKDNSSATNVTWSRRTSSPLIVTSWRDTVDHQMASPNKAGSDVLVDIRRASIARVITLGISRNASLINGCCESSSVNVLPSMLTRMNTLRTTMSATSAGDALDAHHVRLDQSGFHRTALAKPRSFLRVVHSHVLQIYCRFSFTCPFTSCLSFSLTSPSLYTSFILSSISL